MSTAITTQKLTPETWATIEKVAPTMQKSRLFGVATQEQAAAIMLKGYELGLGMAASFEFINIISDKPALNPRGALALILQSGECVGLKIDDQVDKNGTPTACSVTMKRRGGIEYTATFTMEDAKRADLVKAGGGWVKYPGNMLRWRATGYCADVVFPDVIGGMKRADEFDADLTMDGDVIDGQWSVASAATNGTTKTTTPAQETPAVMLNKLIERHGADAVLAACNNALPDTVEGIAELTQKLMDSIVQTLDDVEEVNPNS